MIRKVNLFERMRMEPENVELKDQSKTQHCGTCWGPRSFRVFRTVSPLSGRKVLSYWCATCNPPEKDYKSERERALEQALARSVTALDDWLNTYASEFCDADRVAAAGKRIMSQGGTLAYIADLQQRNRKALDS